MLARPVELPFDPLSAFEAVRELSGVSFLHSGVQAYGLGRYSILAAQPWKRIDCRNGESIVWENGIERTSCRGLFDTLAEHFPASSGSKPLNLPFYGGPIGYVAYDAGRFLEAVTSSDRATEGCDARFSFYGGALVFDHQEQRVFATALNEDAIDRLGDIVERVRRTPVSTRMDFRLVGELASNFSREDFLGAVSRARELIQAGEIYQVNLAQEFAGECEGAASELYRRLAERNAAPYAAYLDFGDEQIVSSSPERFLKLEAGRVATRPIKGTRPAGESAAASARFAEELASSEKERSELLMIVDLERNDLGRVCGPGSVEVESLFRQERYATVIHQTAEVAGVLEEGIGLVGCLKAMFPGGSITGAPKIRAMQIIDELERSRRGVYTGAIGYCDVSGNADFNIAIRTIRIANGRVSFHVGGGIVWDSDPESEYLETLLKGKAMESAIKGSHV